MQMLSFDDGRVFLDGIEIPGLLQSQNVRGQVRFDEAQKDGMSGKAKTPMGWDDCAVTLTILLQTNEDDTCYDKLDQLDNVFRDTDGGANPKILSVANPHLRARHINQVVFSGLSSQETNRDDAIAVNLSFTEHIPVIVPVEKRVVSSDTPSHEAVPKSSAVEPKLEIQVTGIKPDPGGR